MDSILRLTISILCFSMLASTLFPMCDAWYHGRGIRGHRIHKNTLIKSSKKLKVKSLKRFNKYSPFDSFGFSDFNSYGFPSSIPLPPYNSLAPSTSIAPTLAPPSIGGIGNPNLPAFSPLPSQPSHGPPNPRSIVASPPPPPYISSSPPKHSPSLPGPPKSVPSLSPPPLVYLPPVVFPPPPSPSAHRRKPPQYALWCVAKPTVPDPIIQEAMDYACGSGADCKSIQPNGLCFQPNTLLSHASFAFNNYWQNTKIGGGTCDFGGTAMLVTVDPSYDKCNFIGLGDTCLEAFPIFPHLNFHF